MADYDSLIRHVASTVGQRTKPIARRAPALVRSWTTRSITSYGAKCDGVTNDWAAFKAAAEAAAGADRSVLDIPGPTVLTVPAGQWARVETMMIVRGRGADAPLLLNAAGADWRGLFNFTGARKPSVDYAGIENLTVRRNANAYYVMIAMGAGKNITFDRLDIDGRSESYSTPCEGIQLSPAAGTTLTNTALVDSRIAGCHFGLFMDSSVTGTVSGFEVDGCVFERSKKTDLEFNSPSSLMEKINITGSYFRDNRATGEDAGWGIGLANVKGSEISGNDFAGYPLLGLHVEDRSNAISITNNRFTDCGHKASSYAASVFIVSGTTDVDISGNTFDMARTDTESWAVYVGAGGGSTDPSNVRIGRNRLYPGPRTTMTGDFTAAGAGSTSTPTGGATAYAATFDAGVEGWSDWASTTITQNTTQKYAGSGSLSLAFAADGAAQASSGLIKLSAGKTYNLSLEQFGTSGTHYKARLVFEDAAGAYLSEGAVLADISSIGTWQLKNATFQTPANCDHAYLVVSKTGASQAAANTCLLDDVKITG